MEYEAVGVVATIIIVVIIMVVRLRRVNAEEGRRAMRKVAPGPRWWPVVGNIFQVGWSHHPHESLAKLASNHGGGGIMTLWLGCMCTVVVSSTEVAQDMFRNHDLVLAGRKLYDSMRGRGGSTNEGSLITSHYGPHWRMLRRLSTTQFFLTSRLDAMRAPRRKCIDRMLRRLMIQAQRGGGGVELGRLFFLMNFNLIGNLIFSKELLLHDDDDDEEEEEEIDERGARFYYHAVKVMEYAGKPNLADFVPLLRWLDPQGIRSKTQYHVERAFDIAGLFISERIESNNIGIGGKTNNNGNGNANSSQKDFLDVLLEFRGDAATGPYTFSPRTINVVIFEMFTAGTDTTTSTMEWAMAELLHNPRALKRAQMEVRSKVQGRNHVEEKDVDDLPYLKAVIKETLRLHPPLPFLVPHMAMDSCTMQGYHIPKDSQILVNVWAIARDPKLWDAPLLFWPERFLDPDTTTLDFKGHHFQFIPFGSGRRMCPAMPLAARVLPLALGSLLHKFDWVLPHGLKPEEMDMTEGMGITLRKAVPLKAIPLPYTPPHGG